MDYITEVSSKFSSQNPTRRSTTTRHSQSPVGHRSRVDDRPVPVATGSFCNFFDLIPSVITSSKEWYLLQALAGFQALPRAGTNLAQTAF
ncbi:hypothetical protein VTN77DRAFT_1895 [Rasamsonia byssochlamydoides]|uniref:uncharacterized protein n=1 Tax=Rasamsonia byssochlamydoides TaxID=89139 RepID=UPI0037425756